MIGCLRTRVRKQPIIALYFESEIVLKFYNLEARSFNVALSYYYDICGPIQNDLCVDLNNFCFILLLQLNAGLVHRVSLGSLIVSRRFDHQCSHHSLEIGPRIVEEQMGLGFLLYTETRREEI